MTARRIDQLLWLLLYLLLNIVVWAMACRVDTPMGTWDCQQPTPTAPVACTKVDPTAPVVVGRP